MPSNEPLINTTGGTTRSAGTGPPLPQTEATISPKLLDILQYREPTLERTASDATVLSEDITAVAGGLLENPTSAPVNQTPGQHMTGEVMQRLGPLTQARQDPSPDQKLGGESRPAHAPPQQPSAPKKGLDRWRRVRTVTKTIGLSQGQRPQTNGTPSNATIPRDDKRITTDGLSEGSVGAGPLNTTLTQGMNGGIMQRFGPVDNVQRGPSPPPPPDSTFPSTVGSEFWYTAEETSAVNTGHTARNISGQHRASPNLGLILKSFGC